MPRSRTRKSKTQRRERLERDLERQLETPVPKATPIERILTPGAAASNTIKALATSMILGALVLLFIVYSFSHAIDNPLLTLGTLLAATLSIFSVWFFGKKTNNDAEITTELARLRRELLDVHEDLDELEERLRNIEMVESFEDRLARKELQRRAPNPVSVSYENNESDDYNTTPPVSDAMP